MPSHYVFTIALQGGDLFLICRLGKLRLKEVRGPPECAFVGSSRAWIGSLPFCLTCSSLAPKFILSALLLLGRPLFLVVGGV